MIAEQTYQMVCAHAAEGAPRHIGPGPTGADAYNAPSLYGTWSKPRQALAKESLSWYVSADPRGLPA